MSEIQDVRTLLINPTGNKSINYFFFMVDLPYSDSIAIESSSCIAREENENEFILTMEYVLDEASLDLNKTKSYLLPYFVQENASKIVEVILTGVVNNEPIAKSGDVKTPTIKSRDESSEELDHPRILVVKSQTHNDNLYVIVIIKTLNTHSKTLTIEAITGETNTDLKCTYNPQDNDPSKASGEYIVAANCIDSTGIQFHKAYKKTDDKVSIKYTDPSPTVI